MKSAIIALILTGLAQPAIALSCLQPDALRLYIEARDSTDLYSLVIGRITADGPIALPEAAPAGSTAKPAETTVTLTGRALTPEGFKSGFSREVTLSLTCLSVWCAAPPPEGDEIFAALRHDGDARLLSLSPCPANALPWNGDDEARILNCHLLKRCD